MKLVDKHLVFAQPESGSVPYEEVFYTRPDGVEMMRFRHEEIADDIHDHWRVNWSDDNGRTWGPDAPWQTAPSARGGTVREFTTTGLTDPATGRLLLIHTEGEFPTDVALEGMKTHYVVYRVSSDGGRTWSIRERLVQSGGEEDYTPDHPIEGVWIGRNALMAGNPPIRLRCGKVLLPAMMTPVGPGGEYEPRPGAWTFMEVLVLVGQWLDDGRIAWDAGGRVALTAEQSVRGASEPTVAELADGRLLMVMRAGNDGHPEMPGHKYCCTSDDEGQTWTPPLPWTYRDGEAFHSPGSYSRFLLHSNGNHYWIGNICPGNPQGNRPRFPLVIGQLDGDTLGLIRESVTELDGLAPGDHEQLALSNFSAYEDRETGEIVVRCTRMFAVPPAPQFAGQQNAWVYRIQP